MTLHSSIPGLLSTLPLPMATCSTGSTSPLRAQAGKPRASGQETQPGLTLGCLTHCSHPLQERLVVLDSQAGQIRSQAVQESERLARDKNAALQLLQKVTLSDWE